MTSAYMSIPPPPLPPIRTEIDRKTTRQHRAYPFSLPPTNKIGPKTTPGSVIETELPDTSTYRGRGVPPGGVKIRCSLDLADEFTCAWPALLLRHGASSSGSGGDADEEGGERGGGVEKWRVSAGFGGLVLSKVASGEGAAADSSPFLRCELFFSSSVPSVNFIFWTPAKIGFKLIFFFSLKFMKCIFCWTLAKIGLY